MPSRKRWEDLDPTLHERLRAGRARARTAKCAETARQRALKAAGREAIEAMGSGCVTEPKPVDDRWRPMTVDELHAVVGERPSSGNGRG